MSSLPPGDPEDRCPGLPDDKSFWPLKAEMRFSTPFQALNQTTGEFLGRGTRGR
jgi:hypothetical protein